MECEKEVSILRVVRVFHSPPSIPLDLAMDRMAVVIIPSMLAPNFPYRQLGRMVESRKVWKDKNGRYFHCQVVPVPQGSAQRVTH
jgi:hypothetical protein